MSIGLLIITHNEIGANLLQTATNVLGHCPLRTETIAITGKSDPNHVREWATKLAGQLNSGDGLLVLTDMYGSTPANIASSLWKEGEVTVLAGLNLAMLIKVFNYAQLDLATISKKALAGAQASVISCRKI